MSQITSDIGSISCVRQTNLTLGTVSTTTVTTINTVLQEISEKRSHGQVLTEGQFLNNPQVLDCIVADCLAQAEQHQQRSLTFPAIGTGNLGFPRDVVAKLMLDAVIKFSKKRGSNNVQEVVFILHPSDTPTAQVRSQNQSENILDQHKK